MLRNAKIGGNEISLMHALLIPFVVLIFLTSGLVGFFSFHNGRQAVNNVADQIREETTRRIEEHVHSFLDIPHYITRLNADAIRRGSIDPTAPETLLNHFRDQVETFQTVTSVYFGNIYGGLARKR
jgi:hypothetical protein